MIDTALWWNSYTNVVALAVVALELFIEGYHNQHLITKKA